MKTQILIRDANLTDTKDLLTIYNYYVENTAISFEYTTPSIQDFSERIKHVQEKYPYLVAIKDNKIVGYAYASNFHNRAAYKYNVETSIYVDKNYRQQSIGKHLYIELEKRLVKEGFLNMNACIAYTDKDSSYLTNDSMFFHEAMGFSFVGKFHKSGYKFNKWFDIIWMEKLIGEHN